MYEVCTFSEPEYSATASAVVINLDLGSNPGSLARPFSNQGNCGRSQNGTLQWGNLFILGTTCPK
jgi:hypothetical protein